MGDLHQGAMVLLHSFIKKMQKTPPQEIEVVWRRRIGNTRCKLLLSPRPSLGSMHDTAGLPGHGLRRKAGVTEQVCPLPAHILPLALPRQGLINGLITNDKFCLTRVGRLRLSWPRAQIRCQASTGAYPRGEITHRGGDHAAAAPLARPAHRRGGSNRPAALGPGLSAPPAVGDHEPSCAGGTAGARQPAGDVPCA